MLEISEELLMALKYRSHFEDKTKYIVTKEQLIDLVIKYNNLLKQVVSNEK